MNGEQGGSGCFKWLITGVCTFLLLIVIVVFGGYYVIFHTAWPVRKVVDAFTEGSDVKIKGIEGSISSGFSVKTIRFPDEKGNVNEIDDIGFKYKNEGDVFVINDIHVARAHIYTDDLLDNETDDSEKVTSDSDIDVAGSNKGNDLNLIVKNVDISNVIIENTITGTKVEIEKISLDGFESINNKTKLGTLIVKSKNIDLEVKPVDNSLDFATEHVIKGIIRKGIYKSIIKDITLNGSFKVTGKDSYKLALEMFDGKIKINNEKPQKINMMSVDNFTPNEYISTIFCLKDINFKFSSKDDKGKADIAEFKIGSKLFKVDKSLFEDLENKDLVANCNDGKIQYKCILNEKDEGLPQVTLSSNPEMTPKDILGMLLFGKKYIKLPASQKKKVDQELNFAKGGKLFE